MIEGKISEILSVRQKYCALAREEKALTKPLISDLERIPLLYEWFCEILDNQDFIPNKDTVTQRKKFLFIILYLYSPGTFSGKRMLKGLRLKLAETLQISSQTTISDNCSDIITFYTHFRDYRQDVDVIYKQLCERIRLQGWKCDLT